MAALVIPPVKRPARHPRRQPIILPPQLDKSCILCLLPLRDNKWYDYSGHGNHGTITGATWVSKGRRGAALLFDGVDDYVDCGDDDSLKLTGSFSILCWIKLHSDIIGKNASILDFNYVDGYCLFKRKTDKIRAYRDLGGAGTGYLDGVAKLVADTWYHLAWVVDDTISKGYIYINGALDNSGTLDNTPSFGEGTLLVGRRADGFYFKGIIDEVLIFNRVLTADEIRALYELGR